MYKESITPEELQKLEYISFPGKIYVIDSVGAEFNRAIAYLRSQKVIGFDTETRPTFSPQQPRYGVALLQLSGKDKAFLFRVNSIGMHRRLCNLMADARILKVGAAILDDIRGLPSKAIKACLYYITIAMLLIDPLYLSVLCGFFGGGDMNGIKLLVPEVTARILYGLVLIVNVLVFVKIVLPKYKLAFEDRAQ